MQKQLPATVPDDADSLDLGILLGQNQAFALVAGRCSAARAAALQRVREDKLYRPVRPEGGSSAPHTSSCPPRKPTASFASTRSLSRASLNWPS